MATALIHAMLLIMVVHTAMCAFGGLVGRTQSAGVRGILLCNGRPEPNVLVKLYDDDRGFDLDDLMAEGRSDSNGRFELSGSNAEVTPIDPKLNIYHDCNDGWWPCQRKISIMIPDDYITVGPRAKVFYDAGTIELSGEYSGETRVADSIYNWVDHRGERCRCAAGTETIVYALQLEQTTLFIG